MRRLGRGRESQAAPAPVGDATPLTKVREELGYTGACPDGLFASPDQAMDFDPLYVVSVPPPIFAVMVWTVIGVPAVYGAAERLIARVGVAVVVDTEIDDDCQLVPRTATTE